MKRFLLLTLCGITCASTAFTRGAGWIAIANDRTGHFGCTFVDQGFIVQVYIFHYFTDGSTASKWMLDVTEAGWTHLGDLKHFELVIGTSITGVSVSYEACLQGTFRLMTVNFFGSNADPCGLIGIVAAPAKYGVRSKDCAENVHYIPGGEARVNPVPGCWCGTPPSPVESTTWGKVKALYR